ncbi:MAG: glycosyltransferase [Pseudomonadota bacterium]
MPIQLPQTLVTVSSESFLIGTRIMLESFLTYNRWFSGRIVIVHRDVPIADQERLVRDFPKAMFRNPSPDLAAAIDRLIEQEAGLSSRSARFLSLESFWVSEPGTLLFCDSDMLFQTDISDVFENDADFLACPDRAEIQGQGRDQTTMAELAGKSGNRAHRSFNAGLMAMGPTHRSDANRAEVLAQLSPSSWAQVQSDHTDQAIFNRMFGREVTLLDPRYNMMVGHLANLRGHDAPPLSEAKVLHFNGPAKPWAFDQHLPAARKDAAIAKAYELWFAAYTRHLVRHHFGQR